MTTHAHPVWQDGRWKRNEDGTPVVAYYYVSGPGKRIVEESPRRRAQLKVVP